jgi:hypothetical protein
MNKCGTCKYYKGWGQGFYDGRHTGNCDVALPPWMPIQSGAHKHVKEEWSCDLHQPEVPEGKTRIKL